MTLKAKAPCMIRLQHCPIKPDSWENRDIVSPFLSVFTFACMRNNFNEKLEIMHIKMCNQYLTSGQNYYRKEEDSM